MANVRSLEAAQFIDRLADNRDKKGWFNNNSNKEGKKENCTRTEPTSIHGLKKPHRARCGNREEKTPAPWMVLSDLLGSVLSNS